MKRLAFGLGFIAGALATSVWGAIAVTRTVFDILILAFVLDRLLALLRDTLYDIRAERDDLNEWVDR